MYTFAYFQTNYVHKVLMLLNLAAVIHPFAETVAYFSLFAIPLLIITLTGTVSIIAVVGYLVYIDFMNYLGHCNFELVPKWLFDVFPPSQIPHVYPIVSVLIFLFLVVATLLRICVI